MEYTSFVFPLHRCIDALFVVVFFLRSNTLPNTIIVLSTWNNNLETYQVTTKILFVSLTYKFVFFYIPKGGHYGNKDVYPYFCPLPYHFGSCSKFLYVDTYVDVFIFICMAFSFIFLQDIISLYFFNYFYFGK